MAVRMLQWVCFCDFCFFPLPRLLRSRPPQAGRGGEPARIARRLAVRAGAAAPPVLERHDLPRLALLRLFSRHHFIMLSVYEDYLALFGNFCGELSPIIPT